MAVLGHITNGFLNRDTFSMWQRAKSALALANSDISGMTASQAGFITMIKGKSNIHVTQVNFRDNEFPTTITAWGAMIDAVNGAGTSNSLFSTAQGTGTLAAVDSIFTGLGDSTLSNSVQAATQALVFP